MKLSFKSSLTIEETISEAVDNFTQIQISESNNYHFIILRAHEPEAFEVMGWTKEKPVFFKPFKNIDALLSYFGNLTEKLVQAAESTTGAIKDGKEVPNESFSTEELIQEYKLRRALQSVADQLS